ncbi:hypothetical protein ACP4OV_031480 [Aristida adscensionis]
MARLAAPMEAGQVAEGRMVAPAAAGGGGGGRAEPDGLPCPRCDSTVTKFCYYNNYNLAQPRHFCKGCRRYWTRGGALRNVPVGGGSRKGLAPAAGRRKRSSAPAAAAAPAAPLPAPAPYAMPRSSYELSSYAAPALAPPPFAAVDLDRRLLDLGGSFSALLAPAHDGRFAAAGILVGAGGAPAVTTHVSAAPPALPPPPQPLPLPPVSQALPDGVFWHMGWPDLSI